MAQRLKHRLYFAKEFVFAFKRNCVAELETIDINANWGVECDLKFIAMPALLHGTWITMKNIDALTCYSISAPPHYNYILISAFKCEIWAHKFQHNWDNVFRLCSRKFAIQLNLQHLRYLMKNDRKQKQLNQDKVSPSRAFSYES